MRRGKRRGARTLQVWGEIFTNWKGRILLLFARKCSKYGDEEGYVIYQILNSVTTPNT